ncbi:energy transducer TonB [Massilia endophytica]|uniref:energy transducer TonB n=1 Tax=Massilia endophytica TaxID=2899220 RepID=UPI001E4992C2|nr:energy transducer TonB [Massilia endophytica]UGQ47783.1 TonB C-terminal domain-containing protein [Massilia endophytica]
MTMAMAGGPYKVPKRHDGWRSVALAVGMHALLFVFLWGGIRWQNEQPTAVEAEVWDLSTQQAAPPPEPQPEVKPEPEPEPPPPPVKAAPPEEVAPPKADPEIALRKEREKKEKERLAEEKKKKEELKRQQEEELAEQKKLEAEKKKKELAEKKLAEEKAAKIRAENMRRMMAQAAGTGSTGTAEKSTAPRMDAGYLAALRAKIQSNVVYAGAKQDIEARFRVTQLPTGEVITVRKIKSSGNPAYDAAVENAINKSSPLPKKKDGTVEKDLELVFNMKDLP